MTRGVKHEKKPNNLQVVLLQIEQNSGLNDCKQIIVNQKIFSKKEIFFLFELFLKISASRLYI